MSLNHLTYTLTFSFRYPTNVPPAFVWRDADSDPAHAAAVSSTAVAGVSPPSGKDILVMWFEQTCDTFCTQKYPGADTAVLFDWRGEDSGPNIGSAADILKLYDQARTQFPNAEVRSGSLDELAEALLQPTTRAQLPVLELEVGDTWSYGIQSDPKKVAKVRAAIRHRARFEATQRAELDALARVRVAGDGANATLTTTTPFTWWSNFSRCLLKGFEHTWGLRYDMCYGGGFDSALSVDEDEASRVGDDPDNPFPYNDIPGGMANASGYANAAFHAARNDPDGYPARHCESSWKDQTNWAIKWANEAIEDAGLRGAIESEVQLITASIAPDPVSEGFLPAAGSISKDGRAIPLGSSGAEVTICPDTGAVCGLRDRRGVEWASPTNPLGLFAYVVKAYVACAARVLYTSHHSSVCMMVPPCMCCVVLRGCCGCTTHDGEHHGGSSLPLECM